ncbi:uncharacterized protein ACR2FA_003770 [Aphomia sociella]
MTLARTSLHLVAVAPHCTCLIKVASGKHFSVSVIGSHAKSKTELTPITITCGLNDIAIISAPVINQRDVFYYLYKPNGDVIKLDIGRRNYKEENNTKDPVTVAEYIFFVIKHMKTVNEAVISPLNNYIVFNVNTEVTDNNTRTDLFYKRKNETNSNDFMIGPMGESDHGNWVLSLYYKNLNEEWIEMIQFITIEITESVPANAQKRTLHRGDTFHLSFSYPITDISSCELTAPQSTFDRCYDRDIDNWDTCGYIVRNLTVEDAGMWRIIGVGRIVYETQAYLEVT